MRKRASALGLLLACLLWADAGNPAAQSSQTGTRNDRLTLDLYLDMETVSDPQLSPDGGQIIYTRGWVDKMNDRRESALWIMNPDGSRNRFLVKGSGARWSPSGDRIAYTAPIEPRGTQIFVRWMDAEGATSQVTRVDQSPSGIAWSPDGKQISFSMLVEDRNNWPIKMPKAPYGCQVDRNAADRRAAELPAGSHRLHRQRVSSDLRRSRVRRHPASADGREFRSGRERMDARRQEHPLQRAALRERRVSVARVRDLRRRRRGRQHPAAHKTQGP